MNKNLSISIPIHPDDKGYWDRECPNEKCMFVFKTNVEDWRNIFADEAVYCPLCGFSAPSDQWYTNEQLETLKETARSYARSFVQDRLNLMMKNTFKDSKSKYVTLSYKPGDKIKPEVIPIEQREAWQQEIKCDACNSRFSVIGSAFFCPCCGKNLICLVFENAMKQIDVKLNTIDDIKNTVARSSGLDIAESLCQKLIEDCIADVVSAFQKYAEQKIKEKCPQAKVVVNDFQVIDKGNRLFKEILGISYEMWLSREEVDSMKLLFQRRHLLEHNSGLVDQKYLDKTGDITYKIGQRIIVTKQDVKEMLDIIKRLYQGINSI